MPLTTRVWGAGKVLFLCGALLLTYVLFAAAAMRMALKTREVVVPELAGKTVNDASAALAEPGLTLKVEEGRKVDPEGPGGSDPRAGAARRRADAAPAERAGLDQRRPAVDDRAGARRRVRTDGAVAGGAGRFRRRADGRDSIARLRRRDRGRAESAGQEQVRHDFAARQSGRARGHLRHAGSHRSQRRPGRRTCCGRGASACRSSAITPIRACPAAWSCARARRRAFRSLPASRSRSRSAGERADCAVAALGRLSRRWRPRSRRSSAAAPICCTSTSWTAISCRTSRSARWSSAPSARSRRCRSTCT